MNSFHTSAWPALHLQDWVSPQLSAIQFDCHPHQGLRDEGCYLKTKRKDPHTALTNQNLFAAAGILTPNRRVHLLPTCTEISTRAASVSLQQHTLRGHLCPKSSLDVVNKILAVRTVHPDSFPQWVLNVHLKWHFRLTKSSYIAQMKHCSKKGIWFWVFRWFSL